MESKNGTLSPGRLAVGLALYFGVLIGAVSVLLIMRPEVIRYLPLAGTDALGAADLGELSKALPGMQEEVTRTERMFRPYDDVVANVRHIALFVFGHLTGTILVMLPITWTYRAINFRTGFSKMFVRSLIVLPICATTIVLLIQDSLALAFGLAALVAAVRFRVTLDDAMDGIFIFAAICVGLAGGIGFVGVACMMSIFFCFSNLLLWKLDFGSNPVDDLRRQKKREKLKPAASDQA